METQKRAIGPPLRTSVRVLGLYIRGTALVFLSQIAFYAVGFAIARLPWWPLMALGCAMLGLIPHVGSLIGISLVLLISWSAGVGWMHLGIAAVAWLATAAIESFWLAPRVLGKPLGLKAITVFVVVLLAGIFAGPIGLLIAVPTLAVAMVWVRFWRRKPLLPE